MATPSDLEKKVDPQHIEAMSGDGSITEEHRQYLLAKHSTVNLEPLPDMNDADPYNWPTSKKVTNLVLVAFHGMMATFTAAAIQSAFHPISLDLHVSLQRATYLTSLVIAVLGGAPLFWRPLSDRYGRRPIFIISLIGSLVGNIACAQCHSFGTMGLCRAITAFFICPAAAIGSAVVSECFFKHQRARYMGIWTLMVTLGVPSAPFFMGFVALRVGYRWIYYILAITNAIQLILYSFLGPETRYIRGQQAPSPGLFKFQRIDPRPLTWQDFLHPLALFFRPCVLIPATAYAMIFGFGSVLISIEIPQLFVENFGFNTQQVGLQNISIIVGSLIGEQVGGFMSDKWMARRRRTGSVAPEFRLWLSYLGYALTIGGVIMFLVCLDQAGTHWNIKPLIGAAIGAGGNQVVTTVLITYAVDCYPQDSAAIGAFVNLVRQTWGFIGPFWYPQMIAAVGLSASSGITTALMVAVSVIPTIFLQWLGSSWRSGSKE